VTRASQAGLWLALVLALGGCDDEPIQMGRPSSTQAVAPSAPSGGEEEPDAGPQGPSRPQLRDEDFVEAETNRDPFRNYAENFRATGPRADQTTRDVKLPDTSVEEMRLIGIVSGVADPRAMIVDRAGVGHVVRRGNFLGRAEVVQAGGIEELPIMLNWRVDRIRPNEVVLTREDPTAPNRPPLTRVIVLREEDAEGSIDSR
jgi:type IV pilus assembly protein PilP